MLRALREGVEAGRGAGGSDAGIERGSWIPGGQDVDCIALNRRRKRRSVGLKRCLMLAQSQMRARRVPVVSIEGVVDEVRGERDEVR